MHFPEEFKKDEAYDQNYLVSKLDHLLHTFSDCDDHFFIELLFSVSFSTLCHNRDLEFNRKIFDVFTNHYESQEPDTLEGKPISSDHHSNKTVPREIVRLLLVKRFLFNYTPVIELDNQPSS